MADRLVYSDNDKTITVTAEATADTPQVERYDWHNPANARLAAASATLRQWAATADATTATAGNAVAVVNGILDNLAVFYKNFADLLDRQYRP